MSERQQSPETIEAIGVAQEVFEQRMTAALEDVIVIDVRRANDFLDDPRMIPGARRGDPDAIDEWAQALPKDRDIVVYCVRGGSVSRSVAPALCERGLRAQYLVGGLAAWKERGGKTNLAP